MKTNKATLNQNIENLGENLKEHYLYHGIEIPPTNYRLGQ